MTHSPSRPLYDSVEAELPNMSVATVHPLTLSSDVPAELVPPIEDFLAHCENSLYSLDEAVMTGYGTIDQDHHDIAMLVNAAEYFALTQYNRDLTSAVIDELVIRAVSHFQYEEQQFLPSGIAFPSEHVGEHGRLLRHIGQMQDQVRSRGVLPSLTDFMNLHDLFRRHSHMDRALVALARQAEGSFAAAAE